MGPSGKRAAILAAAAALFAERGYSGATVRAIATEAGVDPALVYHYFGGKDRLFAETVGMPIDPAEAIERVVEPGVDGLGERLMRLVVAAWGGPDGTGGPAVAVLRSAVSNPAAQEMLREFVTEEVLVRIARGLELDQPDVRAALMGSQAIGLVFARYVVGIEPLASMPTEALVAWYAPVLQHYATAQAPAGA